MCYYHHIVMMKLQLGTWQPERELRPHEREHAYHVRLRVQKQAQTQSRNTVDNAEQSGWQLLGWLRRKPFKLSSAKTRLNTP
ncbi:hypothetical protein A9Q94_01820 [Rhodobacterales bacterium 56_14_T64]|nr:hypothetical protein A9Q94_01820 [Rhodobacterales bacterium 56_14_T64]